MQAGHLSNFLLALGSSILMLGVAEMAARTVAPPLQADRHYVWPPNLDTTFEPNPAIMPGVAGPAHFVTNNRGIRGDDLSDEQRIRILAVGGSTTECLYLATHEAWPMLLQQKLADRTGAGVWVGNTGKSGQTTYGHIEVVRHLLAELPGIDMILVLPGVNDVSLHLASGRGFEPDDPVLARNAFFARYEAELPFYRRTALWALIDRTLSQEDTPKQKRVGNDLTGLNYDLWRRWRAEAREIVSQMPDLRMALDAYERNLNAMVDLAEQRSVSIVLMTQPALWRQDLTPEESALLWFGWVGPRGERPNYTYYDVDVLAEAMALFNARLLQVCRERRLDCIDLDRHVPRTLESFYDDVHFNEAGSRRVAEIVAQHLERMPSLDR
jgi:lysophospholipase L1-like esterase